MPSSSGFDLSNMTDDQREMVKRALDSGNFEEVIGLLKQKMQRAQAMQNQPQGKYSTPAGTALGAIGGLIGGIVGKVQEGKAEGEIRDLLAKRTQSRSDLLDMMTGAPEATAEEALKGIAAGSNQFSTDPSATPQQMRAGQAQADTMGAAQGDQQKAAGQQRRRKSALLGMLTGDPVAMKMAAEELASAQHEADQAQQNRQFGTRYGPQAALGGLTGDTYGEITKRKVAESDRWQAFKNDDGDTILFNKKTGAVRLPGAAGTPNSTPAPGPSPFDAPDLSGGGGAPGRSLLDAVREARERKKLPADVRKQLDDSEAALSGLDQAEAALKGQPGAFGWMQKMSEYMPQIKFAGIDPLRPLNELADAPARMARTKEQEEARTVMFAQAAEAIHKLYGGALTEQEMARARQFEASANDSDTELQAKINGLRKLGRANRDRLRRQYLPKIYGGR